MIARIWRCKVLPEKAPQYLKHFQESVFPEVNNLNGFREVRILQQENDGIIELTVISFWDSLEAIKAFAGDNIEMAVVAPAAQAILLSFETIVTHHEVVLDLTKT
jgi:heme-degrading monooxygenase HmoA